MDPFVVPSLAAGGRRAARFRSQAGAAFGIDLNLLCDRIEVIVSGDFPHAARRARRLHREAMGASTVILPSTLLKLTELAMAEPPPSVGELRHLLQRGAHAPRARQGYAAPSTGLDSRAYRINHLVRRSPSTLRSDSIIGTDSSRRNGRFPAAIWELYKDAPWAFRKLSIFPLMKSWSAVVTRRLNA